MIKVGASYDLSPAYTIYVSGRPRLVYLKYEYTPNRGLTILEVREMTIIDRLISRVNFNTKLKEGTITIPGLAFGLLNLFGPYKDLKVRFDTTTFDKIINIYTDR